MRVEKKELMMPGVHGAGWIQPEISMALEAEVSLHIYKEDLSLSDTVVAAFGFTLSRIMERTGHLPVQYTSSGLFLEVQPTLTFLDILVVL